MDIQFTTANLGNALVLMLLGMVGIFVVMAVIYGVVVLLNKTADKHAAAEKKQKKSK